jgi:hypothetical protein
MEKTYKILANEKVMTDDEIRRLYKGYWVYIVKAVFDENNVFISGIPVIIGTKAHDGAEDGIYEKYKSHEYDERTNLCLLPNRGFISSLRIAGGYNG